MTDVPRNAWEWIEERAAILEYDAGLPRHVAEVRAFMLWFNRFICSDQLER